VRAQANRRVEATKKRASKEIAKAHKAALTHKKEEYKAVNAELVARSLLMLALAGQDGWQSLVREFLETE
jgi:hypothetical protein